MLLACLSAFGCGNPASDRLAPGDRVIVLLYPGIEHKPGETTLFINSRPVEVGTEAVVVSDEGDLSRDFRDVVINVRGGPEQGVAGTVARSQLRRVK